MKSYMNAWMKPLFSISREYMKMFFLNKWMYPRIYEILFLIDFFFVLYEWMHDLFFLEKDNM